MDAGRHAPGYLIYEYEGDQPVQIGQTNGSASFFGVSGLAPGSMYAFNLVAFDSTSVAATNWIPVSTLAGIPAPGNFTGSRLTDTQVQLSWTAAAGATGYDLYEFAGGQPTLINSLTSTATSATVSNLTANTNYAFNLVAFDTSDSSATPWITVSTAPLVAPANFAGTPLVEHAGAIDVDQLPGRDGVQLVRVRKRVARADQHLGSGHNVDHCEWAFGQHVVRLQPGGNQFVGHGRVAWIGVSTFAPSAPPATFTGPGISSSQINLQWSLATGALGYDLYQFEAGSPVLIATLSASQTSDSVTGLSPSTAYAFNLVAFNSTETAATSWISVATTS